MDTPVGPVKSRPIRLSYPCAVLATAMIVGGAPPAAPGLTGCAAPPAQSPVAVVAQAPTVEPPLLAVAPTSAASPPAPSLSPIEPPVASADTANPAPPVGEPPPALEPMAPAHVWKGGEFQRSLAQLAQWVKKNGGALGAELDDVASGAVLGSVAANKPENPAS
ncbi:MAG: hypothetical protein ABW061_03520, partial [Polyangiaceae bacterium]